MGMGLWGCGLGARSRGGILSNVSHVGVTREAHGRHVGVAWGAHARHTGVTWGSRLDLLGCLRVHPRLEQSPEHGEDGGRVDEQDAVHRLRVAG
eukprot:7384227-Prymnesium_polylepis.2